MIKKRKPKYKVGDILLWDEGYKVSIVKITKVDTIHDLYYYSVEGSAHYPNNYSRSFEMDNYQNVKKRCSTYDMWSKLNETAT